MNIDKQALADLIRRQKQLYHDDFNGITATDARNMIFFWLAENGLSKEAERFQSETIKYLDTKKFQDAQARYDAL